MEDDFPIEYKKGFTKFLNCKIDLRNRIFIPRIETEYWVGSVIKELKIENCKLKINVLDIFAGSGCIGISILKNVKNSLVDFADKDIKAIEQIRINLKLNKIPKSRYKIYRSNLFEKLKGKKYDIIFANPPYVAKERIKDVQLSVLKYEPKTSFLAGKKGLLYIRKFLKEAKRFVKPGGIIYLEFDPEQKNDILNILKKENYKNSHPVIQLPVCSAQKRRRRWKLIYGAQFFKDQFKKWRFAKVNLIEASKI
jgi:release factor glutamine methyltransferase